VILLDTHVVVWLAFESSRLSSKARAAIETSSANGEGLAICDITLLT
jgi:PIN domain nuclease of toxin-antitoxin system